MITNCLNSVLIVRSIYVLVFCYLNLIQLQSQSLNDTLLIDEVIISASPISRLQVENGHEIDSIVMLSNRGASLGELLARHSGLNVKKYGNAGMTSVTFRGTSASHTKVLWNGVPFNSPMNGQVDFSLLPMTFVDGLELFYGGNSVRNVSGALGGSVNIKNIPDWENKLSFELFQEIASFNTFNSQAVVGIGNGHVQSKTRLFFKSSNNDFIYHNPAVLPNRKMKNSNADFSQYGLMQEVYGRVRSNQTLSLRLWYHFNERNLPPIMPNAERDNYREFQEDESINTVIEWKRYGSDNQFNLLIGHAFSETNYHLTINGPALSFPVYNSLSKGQTYTSKSSFTQNLFNDYFKVFSGFEYRANVADYHDAVYNESYQAQRNEAELLIGVTGSNKKTMVADFVTRSIILENGRFSFVPAISLKYNMLDFNKLSILLNLARNYRQPSLNDLYWVPGGNPDLENERGYSFDLGVRNMAEFNKVSLQHQFVAFYSDINNWILWKPGEFMFWRPRNLEKVVSRGAEYRISGKGETGMVKYELSGNYTYTISTQQGELAKLNGVEGMQLIYTPRTKFNVLFVINYEHWFSKYAYDYTGARFTTTDNDNTRLHKLPAFGIHGVQFGRSLEINNIHSVVTLGIDNVFDVMYQSVKWRPMPGRNYNLLLKLNF